MEESHCKEIKIKIFNQTKTDILNITYQSADKWKSILVKILNKLFVPSQAAVFYGLFDKKQKRFLPLWEAPKDIGKFNLYLRWRLKPEIFPCANDYNNFYCLIQYIGFNGFKLLLEEILYELNLGDPDILKKFYIEVFHIEVTAIEISKENSHDKDIPLQLLLTKATKFLKVIDHKWLLSDCEECIKRIPSIYTPIKAWPVFLRIINECPSFKKRCTFFYGNSELSCGAQGIYQSGLLILSWLDSQRWEFYSNSSTILMYQRGILDPHRIGPFTNCSMKQASQFFEDIRAYGQLYHWSHFHCKVDGDSVELKCSENQRRWNYFINANETKFDEDLLKPNTYLIQQFCKTGAALSASSSVTSSQMNWFHGDSGAISLLPVVPQHQQKQSPLEYRLYYYPEKSDNLSLSNNKSAITFTTLNLADNGSFTEHGSNGRFQSFFQNCWEIENRLSSKLNSTQIKWTQVAPENQLAFMIGNSVNSFPISEFKLLTDNVFRNMTYSKGFAAHWKSHDRYVFLRCQTTCLDEVTSLKDQLLSTYIKAQFWSHPGICDIYGVVLSPIVYLVSQLGVCSSLHTFLTEGKIDIDVNFLLRVAGNTAEALQYLHDRQFCWHGNVTLNNLIMFSGSENQWFTKLSDPGCETIVLKKDNLYNSISSLQIQTASPKYLDLSYLSTSLLAMGLYSVSPITENRKSVPTDTKFIEIQSIPNNLKEFLLNYRRCQYSQDREASPTEQFLRRLSESQGGYDNSRIIIPKLADPKYHIVAPDLGLTFNDIPTDLILDDISDLTIDMDAVLGGGNYGQVYKGSLKFENYKRNVAVKIPTEKYSPDEVKMLAACKHEFILKILKFSPDCKGIVMEIAHSNLEEYFTQHGRHHGCKMFNFLSQICEGLIYLSSKFIVHRDIACRNIMLMEENGQVVKIGDFGLARLVDKEKKIYQAVTPNELTYYWLPPDDVIRGQYNCQTDIWSFGVVVYEFFHTRSPPDHYRELISPLGANSIQTYHELIRSGKRLSFDTSIRNATSFQRLVDVCWKTDLTQRFRNFLEIRTELYQMKDLIIESCSY